MQSRFIPKIFSEQGITSEKVSDPECENFLLKEYAYSQNVNSEIDLIANKEWNSRNFSSLTSWCDWFRRLSNKTFVDFILKVLEDNILIDLGGGKGPMSEFAFLFKARAYVNVDIGFLSKDSVENVDFEMVSRFMPYQWTKFDSLRRHIDLDPEHKCKNILLKIDMLDFLSRLPDNSVGVITLNGIDNCIIHTRAYMDELNYQIRRVLKVNGILFGNNSVIWNLSKLDMPECLNSVPGNFGLERDFILIKGINSH
jgi:hypothetical protein